MNPTENNTQQTVLSEKKDEVFSWSLAWILPAFHLLALPAFFYLSWFNFGCWLAFHIFFGAVGISLGNHRYLSHRSYLPKSPFKEIVSVAATLCFQGGPLFWAASHRVHHLFSESFGDPHSAARGFIWSHFGWMFYKNPNGYSYIKSQRMISDLKRDPFLRFLQIHSTSINVGFLVLTFTVCWAIGRPALFFWVGPLRVVSIWHTTWMINSFAHRAKFFGQWRQSDIRNSLILSGLLGGEGDHDFHHRHPTSVRHAGGKLHFDYVYWILCVFKKVGLVNFRPPTHISNTQVIKNKTRAPAQRDPQRDVS